MEPHLRAGIAIYNAGQYHAAHDAWEDYWLDLPEGADKDFLQGLIQFTASVHHTTTDNWEGASGLATSALAYLDGLDSPYRGVDLEPIRTTLERLAADPQAVTDPPKISHEGTTLDYEDLDFTATAIAAEVLAEELGYDETVVEDACGYAHADLDAEVATSQFVTLVFDFVRDAEHRGIIAQRLGEHVQRRRQRESDVEGLF